MSMFVGNAHVGMRSRPSPFKAARPVGDAAGAGASAAAGDPPSAASSAHVSQPRSSPARPSPPPAAMTMSAAGTTSSSAASAFSSFLLSPEYHAYERDLRADGSVDLSRRSGGGVGRDRIGLGRGKKQQPARPPRDHDAALPVLEGIEELESQLERDHEGKGDFAIIMRLESKLLKQQSLLHILETQPNSSEPSSIQPLAVPPIDPSEPNATDAAKSTAASSVSHETSAAAAGISSSPSSLHRVSLLSDSTLRASHRLRTLCSRLTNAGLLFVREKQIVDGCALLKVYAPSATLEQAAFRLRLKMPLKPMQEAPTAVHGRSVPNATPDPAAATAETACYTFLPFDPAIRDQFLGTQDPACLFRSSERQILIDFILRLSRAEGGAGLGNQAANELEYRRKAKAKRKERLRRRKERAEKLDVIAAAAIAGTTTAEAVDAAGGSSSDDDDELSARSTDEVPHIEQYICDRFPLHSSRLDALDSWISYWHLRKKLGGRAWLMGLFMQPLDAISAYFGHEVAFYYSFMNFYIRSLIVPSVVGLILFLTQLSVNNIDSPLLPVFAIFFAIWSSLLIEVWKRRESSLSWRWGSFEYELDDESSRPEFNGITRVDPVTNLEEKVYPLWKRAGKLVCSTLLWIAILATFSWCLIYVFSNWDVYAASVKDVYLGSRFISLDMLFVPCVWGVLIPILDLIFNRVAMRLTEWENWQYGSTFRALLIAKVFSFRFANAFLALYYYMFAENVEDSFMRLTTSVASFMICSQMFRFFLSVGVPYVSKRWNGSRARKRAAEVHATGAQASNSVPTAVPELSQAWLESTYPEYDHFEEYANMAIQFGYVCFFSVAFPFAPVCALINNLISVRGGAYKLCRLTKRPLACKASGIGIWLWVLQLMSIIAVLTNCALMGITSLQLSSWFPELSKATKILLIFLFEHIILALKVLISFAIPDVTKEVATQRKKEKLAMNAANTELMELRRKQILQQLHSTRDIASDPLYRMTL